MQHLSRRPGQSLAVHLVAVALSLGTAGIVGLLLMYYFHLSIINKHPLQKTAKIPLCVAYNVLL